MRRLNSIHTLFLASAISISAAAQTAQPPDAAPAAPVQATHAVDAPLNPALPTVFIVGDSTARNNADLGWGDHFASLFDTTRVNIANRAIAGRSSRTYINEGHWEKTLAEMKSGDYLLLQMGHNDSGDLGGAKPRGSLHSIGDETKEVPIDKPQTTGPLAGLTTETVHSYGWYLRKMIDEARAKGVQTEILTTTIRNIWTNGHIEKDIGYNDLIRQTAAQEKIPVIDMGAIEAQRLEALGPAKTALLFPKDHTHTSAIGAQFNAINVADALRAAHSPLVAYLKPD
jgi:rhamnogalacturonan acetylesterase